MATFSLDEAVEAPKTFSLDEAVEKPSAAAAALKLIPGGETAAALVTGAAAPVVGGLAGLAATVLPGKAGQGAETVEKVSDALTYHPQGKEAQWVMKAVSYLPEKLAKFADSIATKYGADNPIVQTAINTAVQSLPLLVSKGPIGERAVSAQKRALEQAQNALRDQTTMEAKKAGYALPPAQVAPGFVSSTLEGIATKTDAEKVMSAKNQPITNQLTRDEFGFAADQPLSRDLFRDYRRQEGQRYAVAGNTGLVDVSKTFTDAVDAAMAPVEQVAKDYPPLAKKELLAEAQALKKPQVDSSSLVEVIADLREKANVAKDKGELKSERKYRELASLAETELEDHLVRTGQPPEVIQAYRDARVNIAKAHAVEDTLRASGDVDAKMLAKQWRQGKGVPFTGNLNTIVRFADQFPKVAQVPDKFGGVGNPVGPWLLAATARAARDAAAPAALGAGAYATGSLPLAVLASLPLARPALRHGMATNAFQKAFVNPPKYGPSTAAILGLIQKNPITPLTEMGLAQD